MTLADVIKKRLFPIEVSFGTTDVECETEGCSFTGTATTGLMIETLALKHRHDRGRAHSRFLLTKHGAAEVMT